MLNDYERFLALLPGIIGRDQTEYLIRQCRTLVARQNLNLAVDFSALQPDDEGNKFVVSYAQVLIEEMKQLDLALFGTSSHTANEPNPCSVGLASIDYTIKHRTGEPVPEKEKAEQLIRYVHSQNIEWTWLSRLMSAVSWVAVAVLNYLKETPDSSEFHDDGHFVLNFARHGGILESRGTSATVQGLMRKPMVMAALSAASGICLRLDMRLDSVCDEAEEQFAHGTLGLARSMRLRRHDMQLLQHADGLDAVLEVLTHNGIPEKATWGEPPTQLSLGQFFGQQEDRE